MKTVLFILSSVPHPDAKIGRRQAVMIEDAEIATLLLAWAAEVEASEGEAGRLFLNPPQLRVALRRVLAVFDDGAWDTRCLHFVWHSFRHGGQSRAYLRGFDLSAILIRSRWVVESSGRHYIQSGRQLLLALILPAEVSLLARRVAAVGLHFLQPTDLWARLR